MVRRRRSFFMTRRSASSSSGQPHEFGVAHGKQREIEAVSLGNPAPSFWGRVFRSVFRSG